MFLKNILKLYFTTISNTNINAEGHLSKPNPPTSKLNIVLSFL